MRSFCCVVAIGLIGSALLVSCKAEKGDSSGGGAGMSARIPGTGTSAGAGAGDALGLGYRCDDGSSCAQDLYCAMGGELAGLCTAECDSTSICQARYGEKARCVSGLCYLTCAVSVLPPVTPNGPSQRLENYFECPTEICDRITDDYGLCVATR